MVKTMAPPSSHTNSQELTPDFKLRKQKSKTSKTKLEINLQ